VKKLLLTVLAAALLALPARADEQIHKLIELKYANVHLIRPLLGGYSAQINVGASDRVFTITGSKEVVAEIEEMIKKLDVPEHDIELTVYMLLAGTQSDGAAPLSPDLDPVIKQLKGVFSYRAYRLLDSFVLRVREGHGADSEGFLSPLAANMPGGAKTTYLFSLHTSTISVVDKNHVVGLYGFHFKLKVPHASGGGVNYAESSIHTDVDVREGQKVVVGKSSLVDGTDGALILVVAAKIVD
jgi:hypothetical protein